MNNKAIDVYLIAGQSNASGYTVYKSDVLENFRKSYKNGNYNVHYSGRAEYTVNVNTPYVSTGANEIVGWIPVTAGLGISKDHIGPELGMAAYLSENYYNGENDKTAGLIKFAHGGTSLLNNISGENAASGNWVSPSYAKELGIDYGVGRTEGGLYRGLLEQVMISIDHLKKLGYEDITMKGLFWMQGESDRYDPIEYEKAFGYFINDIRRDLGEIMEKDLTSFPIIIGEISKTTGSADENSVAVNKAFIETQRAISRKSDNVYCIQSGEYDVNFIVNGENKPIQDGWHWGTTEMLCVGELVGKCIINDILKTERK